MKVMNVTERTGKLAGLTAVNGDEDLMVITDTGLLSVQMWLIFLKLVVQPKGLK